MAAKNEARYILYCLVLSYRIPKTRANRQLTHREQLYQTVRKASCKCVIAADGSRPNVGMSQLKRMEEKAWRSYGFADSNCCQSKKALVSIRTVVGWLLRKRTRKYKARDSRKRRTKKRPKDNSWINALSATTAATREPGRPHKVCRPSNIDSS